MSQMDHQAFSSRSAAAPRDVAQVAAMLQHLKAGADLRRVKIRRIRMALRARDYENPLKLDVALDRLTDEIRLPKLE